MTKLRLSYVVPLKQGNRFSKGRIPEGSDGWNDACVGAEGENDRREARRLAEQRRRSRGRAGSPTRS